MDEYRNSKDKTEPEFYAYTTQAQDKISNESPNPANTNLAPKYVCVAPGKDRARWKSAYLWKDWNADYWFRINTIRTNDNKVYAVFNPEEFTALSEDTQDKPVIQYRIKIVNNAFGILCVPRDSDIRLSTDDPCSDVEIKEQYNSYVKAKAKLVEFRVRLESTQDQSSATAAFFRAKIFDANQIISKTSPLLAQKLSSPYLFLQKAG